MAKKGGAWSLRQNFHHLRNTGLLLTNVCAGPIGHQARPSEIHWLRLPECGCKWPSTRNARAKLKMRAVATLLRPIECNESNDKSVASCGPEFRLKVENQEALIGGPQIMLRPGAAWRGRSGASRGLRRRGSLKRNQELLALANSPASALVREAKKRAGSILMSTGSRL